MDWAELRFIALCKYSIYLKAARNKFVLFLSQKEKIFGRISEQADDTLGDGYGSRVGNKRRWWRGRKKEFNFSRRIRV
jgi:hypothetical protein